MTDQEVVAFLLDELFTTERLPLWSVAINKREELFDQLPDLAHRELVATWQEKFLMVLPAGLALASPDHRDQLAAWVDGTKEAFAQAHRSNESKDWTISELSARTGLPVFPIKVALLYRARFLPGCRSVGFDPADGFPMSTHFTFDIRRPRESLMERIERATAPSVAPQRVPPSDLRARLTNGDAPSLPDRPLDPPLPPLDGENAKTGILRDADIDLLLLTATVAERDALLRRMRSLTDRANVLRVFSGAHTYYIGLLGHVRVAVTRCKAGSVVRDGSALTANEAIMRIRPRGVVAVGFAFGGYTNKLKIGDVLLSTSLVSYDVVRRQPDGDISRSSQPDAGPLLLNRFRETIGYWKYDRGDGYMCQIVEGMILSGDELVDDLNRKVELFTSYPEAIGGEMEGSGLYAGAAKNWLSEWLIVKAVCDWADGSKDKRYQWMAADAAASLVEYVLSSPDALADLPKQSPSDEDSGQGEPDDGYERPRDLRTLGRLLRQIPASKLDYYFELAESGLLLNETFFLWESFNAEVRASSFHLFDSELLTRVRAFWNGWQRSLSFGNHFQPRRFNPPSYRFSPDFPHEQVDERQAVVDDYNDAVNEARETYSTLMNYVKRMYPEIDLEVVDLDGCQLLHKLMRRNEEPVDASRPHRASSVRTPQSQPAPEEMPTERDVGRARAPAKGKRPATTRSVIERTRTASTKRASTRKPPAKKQPKRPLTGKRSGARRPRAKKS